MELKNKTVLITGASKGIGKALALTLAEQQAKLVLAARGKNDLSTVKREIEKKGAQVQTLTGDVSDEFFANRCIENAIEHFGQLDVLVNNAGVGIFKSSEEMTPEEWDEVMETNVKGTFLFCKAALSVMKKAGRGQIVQVASDVSKRVFSGGALYCASKYAQDAYSAALRKEVRKFGIKVSVVYPGLVDTYFHSHAQGDPVAKDWLRDSDVADAILYIISRPDHVVIDELMLHPMSQEY